MTTRRSRPPRSRKSRASEAPQNDVALLSTSAADVALGAPLAVSVDPTTTAQLRALEAGWDELLG
jgi:hypothetical protein